MDQGPKDHNSETRDFSAADEGDDHNNVNLVNIELEPQIADEIHSSADFPEGAFNLSFASKAADPRTSRKPTATAEFGTLAFVNTVIQDYGEHKENSTRPKRLSRPSVKLIANRLQTDTSKLERLWQETAEAISKLQGTPDSAEALRKAVGDLRSAFNKYQLVWVSLMDLTAYASLPKESQERQTLEEIMRTRKEIVEVTIMEGIDRKNDLLRELGSACPESRASKTSISSSAIRAHARGEAAAALKKAEMQRKINELQSISAIALELEERKRREDELVFAWRKREDQARLESLRVEQEAAAAVARAEAIDEELGLSHENQLPDLPVEEPRKRVEEYVNSQPWVPEPRGNTSRFTTPDFLSKSVKKEKQDPLEKPNPGALPSTSSQTARFSNPADRMECLIQFMTRRELIANKIEKFDDRPENFNTWKAAFKNMTNDVNITASEELPRMLAYTTGQSKRLVQRLRNAYIENLAAGVQESWKKLGERFGSTAIITNVHLNKLTTFPALAPKDNKGLQELGDLMLELQCAKEDGGLAGLKILDESAFLKPVLIKLLEELQGRWQRHAHRFKSPHGVDYPPPPFRAQERNNPFLSIENQERKRHSVKPPVKPLNEPSDEPSIEQGLSAFRTDITDDALKNSTTLDPARWCVVHKLSHPLSKCRAFRVVPLTERKNLLSQHRICFHCLATTNHLAKD